MKRLKFKLSFFKKHLHLILFLLVITLATFLRLYALSDNPVGLNQDEAVNGYDAYSIAWTGKDHHGNFLPIMMESFEDWSSPLLTYITVPFVGVFGLSEFTVRLPAALLGVGTVALMYVFLKQLLKNKNIALIGAFLLGIMPWHIALSRWAIPPTTVPFFLMLLLVTFFWAVKDTKRQYLKLFLVGLAAGLLTYSYPTQKLFAPLLLAVLCLVYFRKKIANYIWIAIPYIASVAPIYLLTFMNPQKYNSRFDTVSIFNTGVNPIFEFFARYFIYFTPYFHFGPGDSDIMHHIPQLGTSYEFLTLFFYFGIILCVYIVWKKKTIGFLTRKNAMFLLGWLLIFPIPAALTRDYSHVLRVVHGLPIVIVFSVIAVEYLYDLVKEGRIKRFLPLVFVLVLLSLAANFFGAYFYSYKEQSKESFQYGIKNYSNFLLENDQYFKVIYIDDRINNPYIYYLFYSKFNPKKLNYSEINGTVKSTGGWDGVKSLGKYAFIHMTQEGIADGFPIYSASDEHGKDWYVVLYKDGDAYVVRAY